MMVSLFKFSGSGETSKPPASHSCPLLSKECQMFGSPRLGEGWGEGSGEAVRP